jgi:hypothetical protein
LNILTKICVVLLVVASLVASIVFISLATVQPNYRTLYEKERTAYQQLDLACRSYMEDADRSRSALREAREAAGTDKIKLLSERDNAVAEVRELKMQLLNKDQRHAEMNASLDTLTKSDQAKVKLIETQLKDIRASWARETELQGELVKVRDQWRQQKALAERLAQNNRVLREQTKNLQQQNVELTQKVKEFEARGLGREDMDVVLKPENKIAGTITSVRDNIASINIGSAHGLKKGMQLIVFRGSNFVGFLKIDSVDVNEAVGVMTEKHLSPMQGDKVSSSLE